MVNRMTLQFYCVFIDCIVHFVVNSEEEDPEVAKASEEVWHRCHWATYPEEPPAVLFKQEQCHGEAAPLPVRRRRPMPDADADPTPHEPHYHGMVIAIALYVWEQP